MSEPLSYASSEMTEIRETFLQLAKDRPELVTPRFVLGVIDAGLPDPMGIVRSSGPLKTQYKEAFRQILQQVSTQDSAEPHRNYIKRAGAPARRSAKLTGGLAAALATLGVATHLSYNRVAARQFPISQDIAHIVRENGGSPNNLSPHEDKLFQDLSASLKHYEKIMQVEGPVIEGAYLGSGIALVGALALWLTASMKEMQTRGRLRELVDEPAHKAALKGLIDHMEPMLERELENIRTGSKTAFTFD